MNLWAFSESVSPQLVHGISVSQWALNVFVILSASVVLSALCDSECPQQL